MRKEQRLDSDITQFLNFIQADNRDEAIKSNLISFFREHGGSSHVIHDRGDIYYYDGERLIGFDSTGSRDFPDLIHRFDGRKITVVAPYYLDDSKGYQMKSGSSNGGTKRRRSYSSGTSSNNNNNNNNNNG